MENLKEMPRAIEIEQEVLGNMMYCKENLPVIMSNLKTNDFYSNVHKHIFVAMSELYATGKEIEMMLVIETLGKEKMEKITFSYINKLSDMSMAIDIRSRIAILKEKSYRRKCITNLQKALREAYNDEIKINDTIATLQNNIIQDSKNSEIKNDSELITVTLEEIERRMKNGGELPGMKTGYRTFDAATNGLKKGDLVVVAGRPSMGKTLTALQIGEGAATFGHKVGIIEMEMTEVGIGMRRIASSCMINSKKLQRGTITDDELNKMLNYADRVVKNDNIFTDCGFYQNIMTITSKAKSLKMSKGLDILIIDHLTLMDMPDSKNMSYAIGAITRKLKMLAKELDICVMLVSQLNRKCEERPDKRPMMSDLGDSKAIEQDADMVMFCYRDEYYDPESDEEGIMEWIIRKQRNGEVGTLKMKYMDKYQRIIDMANI